MDMLVVIAFMIMFVMGAAWLWADYTGKQQRARQAARAAATADGTATSPTANSPSASAGGRARADLPLRTASLLAGERDFAWVATDEPHQSRRVAILAKYPHIRDLFAVEPLTFPIVVALLLIQLWMARWANTASWTALLIAAYVVGGTINHTLQLAVHELSHNLCFATPEANRLLAILANLPTTMPSAVMFQKYHMEHHLFQGVDGVDTDVPSMSEVRVFTNSLAKVLWLILQPVFYAFRPLIIKPKKPDAWAMANTACCLAFDMAIFYLIGGRGLTYLFAGTWLGLGLHPCAGHFVAEHYVLTPGHETYSYYGPCNWLNFNVGYHNEHHDFPRVPWSKLAKVREIAPEFYNTLPSYTSYISVMYRYILDRNIGPFARVKRHAPASYVARHDYMRAE
jgi:sphingolipid delta-4 desaturase